LDRYLKVVFASHYNIFSYLDFAWNDEVASMIIEDEKQTNIMGELSRIEVPALILSGRFDDQAPPQEMEYIYENVGSEIKEIHIFESAGHNNYLDVPEEFYQEVRSFCEQFR
jgi:pimeloyl-ACP methyl ester carboxylesterase